MKESVHQIEANVNKLLDIYDGAMEAMEKATDIEQEKQHRKFANEATELISREMKKLESMKSFEPEIRVVTSTLKTCVDTGRNLQH